MPKRIGPAESATVTVAVVGVAAGWAGELSATEIVTGLWAAAIAQRVEAAIATQARNIAGIHGRGLFIFVRPMITRSEFVKVTEGGQVS
jgi:hypothetical protein